MKGEPICTKNVHCERFIERCLMIHTHEIQSAPAHTLTPPDIYCNRHLPDEPSGFHGGKTEVQVFCEVHAASIFRDL